MHIYLVPCLAFSLYHAMSCVCVSKMTKNTFAQKYYHLIALALYMHTSVLCPLGLSRFVLFSRFCVRVYFRFALSHFSHFVFCLLCTSNPSFTCAQMSRLFCLDLLCLLCHVIQINHNLSYPILSYLFYLIFAFFDVSHQIHPFHF